MVQGNRPADEAAIRAAVEQRLGEEVPDAQWAYLVRVGTVGIVEDGEEPISWLVKEIRDVRTRFAGAITKDVSRTQARSRDEIAPRRRGDTYLFTRQDALCLAVAAQADKDPEVVKFRREALNERLPTYALDSSREGVEEWLSRQIERERPQLEAFTGESPALTCIRFVGQGLETTPVVPGGVLDRLRLLGERLAARYRWQAHAAVAFVLSGDVVPTIEILTATFEPHHDIPALTRISLTIDPTATPAAVASAYRQARNRIAQARAREMQPKTLFLAAFATERPRRESIKSQIAAWNRVVPDRAWRYKPEQAANFVRDRNAALERLLQPSYQLPAHEETITYDDFTPRHDAQHTAEPPDNSPDESA